MSTPTKFITKYTDCENDFQFLRLWVTEFFEEEYIFICVCGGRGAVGRGRQHLFVVKTVIDEA